MKTEAVSERLAVFGAKVDEAEACSAPARRQAPAAGSRPGPPGERASPERPAICSSPRAERLPGERHDTDRTGRRLGVTTTVQNTTIDTHTQRSTRRVFVCCFIPALEAHCELFLSTMGFSTGSIAAKRVVVVVIVPGGTNKCSWE